MAGTFSPPLAAIPTVFTPPCPITWILTTTKVPSQYPPFPTTAPASCDPPSWNSYIQQRGFAYYSPAICPSGFYVGPSCIVTNPRVGEAFPAIQAGETAAYCVPSGHTCTSDVTDFRGGVWGVTRTATVTGAQATVGPAIQIRWRAVDLDGLETDPLTPGPKSTTTSLIPTSASTPASLSTSASISTSTSTSAAPSTSSSLLPSSNSDSINTIINFPTALTSPARRITTTIPFTTSSLSSSPSDSTTFTTTLSTSSLSTNQSPTTKPAKSEDGQEGTREKDGSGYSTFTTATVVLTAILITILASYGAWAMLNRYKRYRASDASTTTSTSTSTAGTGATGPDVGSELFVFQVEAWLRRLFLQVLRFGKTDQTTTDDDDDDDDEEKGTGRGRRKRRRKLPDAELGTNGPLPELPDTKPFGTRENPAELPSATTMAAPAQERISSWRERVTRVSRLFTKHMSAP